MSAYSPYSQTAIYNRGQQFEIAPSPSSYLLNSLPPRGQNSQFQQPFSYTPQAPSNGISYYQSQQQNQYQTPFQQYSQQPSMIQYVKPQSTILGSSNIANSYQLRDFPQQPIQSSNIIVQQQNYPTDPRTFQHPGYISNNTPLYQSTLSRNSQNDQDIYIQTYSPLQLSRNSAVIEGLVDQTLRNIKTGSTVQHEKRDQNYFFSGYIHISGQGTYKKYPLKSRNNNNNISVSQQESKQKQGTQSFSYDGPVPSQQFMGNLIEIARAEENIERIKSRLVEQQDYNLPAFFKQFDKNQSGKISLSEFIQGQKDFGSTLSQPQAALIFSRVLSNSQALLLQQL